MLLIVVSLLIKNPVDLKYREGLQTGTAERLQDPGKLRFLKKFYLAENQAHLYLIKVLRLLQCLISLLTFQ